ncbi:MAG: 6-phosphofructokinase, partial [Nitrospira sp.]|nr:6-phosphofructokinase [Nitrospira sp.]
SMVDGRFTPLPFKDMLDPATGRTRVRMVDTESESYQIARAYMARLQSEDFTQPESLSLYAKCLNLSSEQFQTTFQEISQIS